jgi:hypothetical protein
VQARPIGPFHLIVRCVRRAFLQGFDEYSSKDYSHRKSWELDITKLLLEALAIDVTAYTNMDNHFHLIVRNRLDQIKELTPLQIIAQWFKSVKIWENPPKEITLTA